MMGNLQYFENIVVNSSSSGVNMVLVKNVAGADMLRLFSMGVNK